MKCKGCGIELQFENQNRPGFISKSVFEKRKKNNEEILCKRCFYLKHYNELIPINLNDNFINELEEITKKFDNLLLIIDIYDFDSFSNEKVLKMLKNKNLIVAINKVDLLPKRISFAKLKEWLYAELNEKYDIKKENVRMISAKSGFGIPRLKKLLNKKNKVLFLGITNSGKSSLINQITQRDVTVSSYPGTTLNIIENKMAKGTKIYDSPGIEPKDRFIDLFNKELQEKIIPKKNLKIEEFNIEKNRVLLLNGYFYFVIKDYAYKSYRPIIEAVLPESCKPHETKNEKINNVIGNPDILFPTYKEKDEINLVSKDMEISEGKELSIPGLGFIYVRRGPLKIKLFKPDSLKLRVRKPLPIDYFNV